MHELQQPVGCFQRVLLPTTAQESPDETCMSTCQSLQLSCLGRLEFLLRLHGCGAVESRRALPGHHLKFILRFGSASDLEPSSDSIPNQREHAHCLDLGADNGNARNASLQVQLQSCRRCRHGQDVVKSSSKHVKVLSA